MAVTETDVKNWSTQFAAKSPAEILEFSFQQFPKIAISTAFGPEGCALIDIAVKIQPDVKVFTIDTDFLFPESIELRKKFEEKYALNVTVLKGAVTIEEQNRLHGPRLFERDTDACCALRKVEPTNRALVGLDAWIAGLRRDQSKTRADIDAFEMYNHDDGSPFVKVNPLLNWTRQTTWEYLLKHGVPYNPLLDQGYKSIGCWPCTQKVAADADERAGRWGGQKAECGIHTFMIRKA